MVLAQSRIPDKTNEIPEFQPLPRPLDLVGKVVTADALNAQTEQVVEEKKAHYVFTVKDNQPTLRKAIQDLDDDGFPPPLRQTNKGHGRIEVRTIQVSSALRGCLEFPHAAQAFHIHRKTSYIKAGKVTEETAYGVNSLTAEKAKPERLLALVRNHWHIENKVHYVRDFTYGEDASEVRTANGPRAMATLRTLAIALIRGKGWSGIPEGNRHCAARRHEILALLGV